jgi:hypothetical protein
MRKNTITTIALTLMFLASATLAQTDWSAQANTDWYTNNTDATEFTITTPEQLAGLAQLVNDGTQTFSGKTITLGNDISLNTTTNWQSWSTTTAPANSWTKIGGVSSTNFTGTFDGAGYVISGVYINNTSSYYQGLFGRIGSGGEVKNLGVVASYIRGMSTVGCLAGQNDGIIT